jgi:hypothetical protein
MRTAFKVVSVLLLIVGLPAMGLSILALAYARFSPIEPPPSMNEGPGMAGLLGLMLLVPSSIAVVVAFAMLYGLKATRPPGELEQASRHKRLW